MTQAVEYLDYTENELLASICRSSFADFLREFWETVVPEELVWNWHMQYLCDELQLVAERVFRGEKKKYDLIINISPGTSKSTIATIMFPAWLWTRMRSCRVISASYAYTIATDLSRKSRDVIKSDKYRALFPDIDIREDQDAKGFFVNTAGGERYAIGVDGGVMGKHAHVIIVDDPLNPKEAASDADLAAANRWMEETLPSRKVDKRVTPTIIIMQRLHEGDPTGMRLEKAEKVPVKHICLPAEITESVKPPELAERYVDGLMDPYRLDHDALAEAEAQGEFVYACTPGNSPVLMSNWTEKSISSVEIGDEVVGFVRDANQRAVLVKSKVKRKFVYDGRPVQKITMQSGAVVYCTPEHKWCTNKYDDFDGSFVYRRATLRSTMKRVYSRVGFDVTPDEQRLFDWLGGMIDGEGAVKHGHVDIYQCPTANRRVYRRVKKVLDKLKFDYAVSERQFHLKGGRSMKMRLLKNSRMEKAYQIRAGLWTRPGMRSELDRPVSIEMVGLDTVYALETETGNYVVWGYASSNSQYLQTPIPRGGAMFDTTRLNFADRAPDGLVAMVRYWDKASTHGGGMYTVGCLMGRDRDNNFWVLDIIRGQWNSGQRDRVIVQTAHMDGKRVRIWVEQEPGGGGKESAQGTARGLAGYVVKLHKVGKGDGDKELRADPFSTQVNAGNVYIVRAPWNREYVNEMRHFPRSRNKDQVDASSGAFNVLAVKKLRVGGRKKLKAKMGILSRGRYGQSA